MTDTRWTLKQWKEAVGKSPNWEIFEIPAEVNTKMWDAVHEHKSNNICFMLLPDLKGIVEMLQWVGDLTNGDA